MKKLAFILAVLGTFGFAGSAFANGSNLEVDVEEQVISGDAGGGNDTGAGGVGLTAGTEEGVTVDAGGGSEEGSGGTP